MKMVAEIPIILKLKKRIHKDLAVAHDIVIKQMVDVFDRVVLHGGTAIWRCYNGNRFSEDIDVYLVENEYKINYFFENLKKAGFIIKKRRIRKNTIFSKLERNNSIVRFEALLKLPSKSILKEYETVDGNFITLRTLTPEQIIKEKVPTYLNRLKIRDLYDIFFMLRYVKNKKEISGDLKRLILDYKKPQNIEQLRELIIDGLVPTEKEMVEYIKRYL